MRYIDLYDLLVFDLDGTLAETREDIAASLNHALGRLGRPACDLPTVTRYIGNGAPVLIARALGPEAPEEARREGLAHFLDHYRAHCLDRTRLYPGAASVLETLAAEGKNLAVLSNKPTAMSVSILEGLGVARRFARIDGGDSFPRKKPDPAGLHAAMESAGAPPRRTLMVGDSAVDVATARAAGTAAAGALWGFKPDELAAHPPDHLLRSLGDLLGPADGAGSPGGSPISAPSA